VVDFADLSLGMLMFHLFTFDPEWLPVRRAFKGRLLVLYDGDCGLCDRMVQFLTREDREHLLAFAPLRESNAEPLAARHHLSLHPQRIMLVENEGLPDETVRAGSDAVLRVLDHLGGIWRVLSWCRWIPKPWRDRVYDLIARHRYRFFGRVEACELTGMKRL
jgi:predicted DCC family thiol-disulfide oxidoreductase YuxK